MLLDFFPNADHAGIYAAQGQGHFKQAGLDVRIRQPSDPATVLKQVSSGKVDLAISYEPQLLAARDKGQRLVAVGALVQEPLTSIISLPRAKIRRPADLKGKTVGTAGIDYQTAFLRTIALEASVNPKTIKERNVGFGLQPALLSRKVDATLGGFWNYEGVDLRAEEAQARRSSAWTGPACRPTTSWCWWPTRTPWSATAGASAPSWARWPAAPATCSATRRPASSRCWRPTRASTRASSEPR